jgi:hypothetical protein
MAQGVFAFFFPLLAIEPGAGQAGNMAEGGSHRLLYLF